MTQREIVSKEKVTARLDEMASRGHGRTADVIQRLVEDPPQDRIIKVGQNGSSTPIEVTVDGQSRVGLLFEGEDQPHTFHRHGLRQFATKLDLLGRGGNLNAWIDGDPWQREIVADVISTTLENTKLRERMLVRSVAREIRGVLSDQYRRLNSADIIQAYLQGAQALGMVPYDAQYDAIKWSISLVLPQPMGLATPEGIDYLGLSAKLRSSDFGASSQELSFQVTRLACINGMLGEKILREVHLGLKLPDDISLSDKTFMHDTERSAGIIHDSMVSLLKPQALEKRLEPLMIAARQPIAEPEKAIKKLRKARRISQTEEEQLNAVLVKNDPDEVPTGPLTNWKLANALSFLGNSEDVSEDRKHELEQLSGILCGLRPEKEFERVEA